MVIKAKEGDSQAARLLLERVILPVKSMEQSIKISFSVDADISTQGQSIIQAVTNRTLAPSQGSSLLTSLGTSVRIKEMNELEKRLKPKTECKSIANYANGQIIADNLC